MHKDIFTYNLTSFTFSFVMENSIMYYINLNDKSIISTILLRSIHFRYIFN